LTPWHILYFLPDPQGHCALRGVPGNVRPSALADDASPCRARRAARESPPVVADPSSPGAEYCRFCGGFGASRPFATRTGSSAPPNAAGSPADSGSSSEDSSAASAPTTVAPPAPIACAAGVPAVAAAALTEFVSSSPQSAYS